MSWWVTFYLNQIAIGNEHLPIIVTGIEEGVLYSMGKNRSGAISPLDCAVKCEVGPAYLIRRAKKGEADFSLPPVNSRLLCEVKHFPQSFFLRQPIKYQPQFYSDDH